MAIRASEIKGLEEEYSRKENRVIVFYGRFGCDKEQYLKQFLKGKQSFYYRAREASLEEQKRMLSHEIKKQYQLEQEPVGYGECFKVLLDQNSKKLVLVIDEFENIVKKDTEFMKNLMELKVNNSVLIILCSSSLVWVEHKMKDSFKEIYKKIDGIHKILDLNFLDVVRSFPDYSVSQCVQVYGVLGGVSSYMRRWDKHADIKENICKHILSGDGFLFREAETYIGSELRELAVYHTLLSAIASGKRKLNDLYRYTGFSRAKISVYLKNLMEFEVVEKVISFETGGWDNAQKGVYQIKDTFINFWFKFVYPNLSDLYRMEPEEFYQCYIAEGLEEHLNRYFIQVCMEYMELLDKVGKFPIQIHKIGTWIGKNGTIDIIAQNSVRENIVGICNWSAPEMTYDRCEELFDSMEQAKISAKQYFLFSAKAFDEVLQRKAKENPAYVLIDMTEL